MFCKPLQRYIPPQVSILEKLGGIRSKSSVPSHADTVVVGGGVAGVSLAYHLARANRDVLLLEKSQLTAGSTWHAAGLVTLYHPTPNVKKIHWDSMSLYNQISAETGQEIGFHRPGSLRLATSPIRLDEFRYALSRQGHKDAPLKMLGRNEVADLVPILNMDGIHGGLLTPGEGHVDPYSLTQAMAVGARKYGANIQQDTEVTGMIPRYDGTWEIVTPQGTINANRVVNCAGFWAREVGILAGMDIPLVPVQHQYLVTKSVPEIQALKKEIPVLRHLDGSFYLRQERDGLLIGPYESPESMVQMEDWAKKGVTPGFGKELYPGDLERLHPHLEAAMSAFPCFQNAEIQSVVNGPITYTPDLLPMVGPTMLPNMWLAVGFGYGIVHGGGIGKYLSEWICRGEAPFELIEFDPLRYGKWTTMEYSLAKTREAYGMNNAISYPAEERYAGRPTSRVTPIHDKLVAAGAHMGFSSGWENPLWYAESGTKPEYKPTFGRANWQLEQGREYQCLTERVGVADLSPFGKIQLQGKDARRFLDRCFAGSVPKPGRTSLTHMLTTEGKVYSEMTITCLNEDDFLLITGGGSELHDLRRLRGVAREERFSVQMINMTEQLGVLGVAGPRSGELMAGLVGVDSVENWKFMEARRCQIGGVECTGVRVTYTGELGWELYPDMKDMESLYKEIITAGNGLGLEHVGTRAINTLRIEKGFRAWGREMSKSTSPIETGLMPFVRLNKKADFIGKKGLLNILQSPPSSSLVFLSIDSPTVDPEGDETVSVLGKPVGYTTSGCYSPVLGSCLAMASLPTPLSYPGTEVGVVLAGHERPGVVLEGPPSLTYSARVKVETQKQARG